MPRLSVPVAPVIRNVILDWSGTLVDDLDLVVRATNAVLDAYGSVPLSKDQFRQDFQLPLATTTNSFYPRSRCRISTSSIMSSSGVTASRWP